MYTNRWSIISFTLQVRQRFSISVNDMNGNMWITRHEFMLKRKFPRFSQKKQEKILLFESYSHLFRRLWLLVMITFDQMGSPSLKRSDKTIRARSVDFLQLSKQLLHMNFSSLQLGLSLAWAWRRLTYIKDQILSDNWKSGYLGLCCTKFPFLNTPLVNPSTLQRCSTKSLNYSLNHLTHSSLSLPESERGKLLRTWAGWVCQLMMDDVALWWLCIRQKPHRMFWNFGHVRRSHRASCDCPDLRLNNHPKQVLQL